MQLNFLKTFLLITLLGINFSLFAQESAGHSIKVRLKGTTEGKTYHLAHFFGYNQYIKVDSAVVQNGEMHFKGADPLKGGIYLIVLSPSQYYDFALNGQEQSMEIEADTLDFVQSAKFKGSKENEILFGYRKMLSNKNGEAEKIKKMSDEGKISREESSKSLSNIQKEIETYISKVTDKENDSFAAKVLRANKDPELPTVLPKKADGRPDSTYLFNYYKGHFFDNIDFSDERLLRSPFIHAKVERYFKDLVYQTSDSVKRDSDRVLKLAKQNNEVYRFVLWWITNKYENSEVVGLDGVFIHLAENYYLKDANWLDSTQKAKFQERLSTLKPLETGLVFPSLLVSDSLGREHSPLQSKSVYTLVHFYDPDCGHCKDAAPKLADFYEKYKSKVTIYNVSIAHDPKKLSNFIQTYKVGKLINVMDYKNRYNFRKSFDVYSTPTNYILDENKRIIARRIPVEKLEDFINFYEKQKLIKAKK